MNRTIPTCTIGAFVLGLVSSITAIEAVSEGSFLMAAIIMVFGTAAVLFVIFDLNRTMQKVNQCWEDNEE